VYLWRCHSHQNRTITNRCELHLYESRRNAHVFESRDPRRRRRHRRRLPVLGATHNRRVVRSLCSESGDEAVETGLGTLPLGRREVLDAPTANPIGRSGVGVGRRSRHVRLQPLAVIGRRPVRSTAPSAVRRRRLADVAQVFDGVELGLGGVALVTRLEQIIESDRKSRRRRTVAQLVSEQIQCRSRLLLLLLRLQLLLLDARRCC